LAVVAVVTAFATALGFPIPRNGFLILEAVVVVVATPFETLEEAVFICAEAVDAAAVRARISVRVDFNMKRSPRDAA
jgi:hypothetical protein